MGPAAHPDLSGFSLPAFLRLVLGTRRSDPRHAGLATEGNQPRRFPNNLAISDKPFLCCYAVLASARFGLFLDTL